MAATALLDAQCLKRSVSRVGGEVREARGIVFNKARKGGMRGIHVAHWAAQPRAGVVEDANSRIVALGVAEAHVLPEVDLERAHPESHRCVCSASTPPVSACCLVFRCLLFQMPVVWCRSLNDSRKDHSRQALADLVHKPTIGCNSWVVQPNKHMFT